MAEPSDIPNLLETQPGYQALTGAAMQLANLALWHLQRIGNTGYLAANPEGASTQPIGSVPNPAATQRRVWLDEPPGSIPFDEQGTISIPAANPGVDTVVLAIRVPGGFDGVIKWISNNLPGVAGFSPGNLIWRIQINNRPVRNFGNILNEKGTIAQGREVSPIRVFSGDLITYTIQQVPPAALTGQTVCSLTGYFFPSKGVS